MKVSMRFKDYLKMQENYLNTPLSLNRLTLPYGVNSDREMSNTLMVGHVIDAMHDAFSLDQQVDFLDVATVAWELGLESAGIFLDEAPYIAYKIAQEEGSRELH